MSQRLDFFYDYASPFSYPAFVRVRELADETALAEVIARAGLAAAKVLARCGDDAIGAQLTTNIEEALGG
jgi:2-hydroxychromene-2-carboxylate isomerase